AKAAACLCAATVLRMLARLFCECIRVAANRRQHRLGLLPGLGALVFVGVGRHFDKNMAEAARLVGREPALVLLVISGNLIVGYAHLIHDHFAIEKYILRGDGFWYCEFG